MQHDEVIWHVIRHGHCSFMAKLETANFCRNPYNVTGLCNRSSCPLANSRYATLRDHDGVFYLYMKTIERVHMPNKLWERLKLPRNYEKALEVIDSNLMYWPKLLVHKIKQRLTKMTQMRIRMRKLALKTREKVMTTPRKEKKREARREAKAEKAALVEKKIEQELLERLNQGVYGEIYNYPEKKFEKLLDNLDQTQSDENEEDEEQEIEYVEGFDDLEDDMEDFGNYSIRESLNDQGDSVDDDDEDLIPVKEKMKRRSTLKGKYLDKEDHRKTKKRPRVVVEVENEDGLIEKQRTKL